MKIAFLLLTGGLLGCALPTDAQIVLPVRNKPAVVDAAMVFEDRGQTLELHPALRATPVTVAGKPGVEHQVFAAKAGAPIGPGQLGVVTNHGLRTQGYLTGEIAFRPRGDGLPAGLDAAGHPGLAKLANPNTWVVAASTPQEFLVLFNRLKARGDLAWVEAVVIYGTAAGGQPRR
jgi:hypothetical protein